MPKSKTANRLSEIVEGILDVIDDSPLLPDEKQADFDLLQHSIYSEIKPRSLLEKLLSHELTQSLWELRRLRRLRNQLINLKTKEILHQRLFDFVKADNELIAKATQWNLTSLGYSQYLADASVQQDGEARKITDRLLKQNGTSLSEVVAEGLSQRVKTILALEATIAELIKRSDRILCELDRRAETRQKLINLESAPTLDSDDEAADDNK